jgi:hypothetical protein
MSKIKLKKVLKEGLKESIDQNQAVKKMETDLKDFRKRLNSLKEKMRKDGYGI